MKEGRDSLGEQRRERQKSSAEKRERIKMRNNFLQELFV